MSNQTLTYTPPSPSHSQTLATMNQNDVEMDMGDCQTLQNNPSKSNSLQSLITDAFSPSLATLSNSSRAIPSNRDFHFYNNFDAFKLPIQKIAAESASALGLLGSNNSILKEHLRFPNDVDIDDVEAHEWLVNFNDELYERLDASLDEFRRIRKEEEETGRILGASADDGFQLVYGKKKKKELGKKLVESTRGDSVSGAGDSGVKVADMKGRIIGGKAKVPFHIPTIKKPQEEYNILVNNSNQPFQHVWLQRSDDGLGFIHPLEKLSVLDFVDKSNGDVKPASPPPTECTPFKIVEEVKDLKELAANLRGVSEFAVDLEHNQYRSFQGLTCLMQISTRTEDFIVDTLKLRIHIGPYLREVFKDPTKKKVMHGADRDIVWLQRDFGIYVCNLFDTGQASRVMKLERHSLEYLLQHFCGVTANKEYQNADWRLRRLTDEMLRYAREDTHYLLYIYDLMRDILLSMPNDAENSDPPLVQVYKRSYDVCMQLYEKELFTESSYLHTYGLQGTGFNAQQLAIVAGLFEWRDAVARSEDESTGFVLPNKTLLEIAKEMPVTTSKLRRLLKSKHPYIERNLGSVVSIIRHSMQNAAAFEETARQLKEASREVEVNDGCKVLAPDTATNLDTLSAGTESISGSDAMNGNMHVHHEVSPQLKEGLLGQGRRIAELGRDGRVGSAKRHGNSGEMKTEFCNISELSGRSNSISFHSKDTNTSLDMSPAAKVTGATVQVRKKPTGAFGALLGSAVAKRKFDTDLKDKEEVMLEKIRSSVNLPFQSFVARSEPAKPVVEEPQQPEESVAVPATNSDLEEIIILDEDSTSEEQENDASETTNAHIDDKSVGSASEMDIEDEPSSLSDLSSSFQKCFQSNNQNNKNAKLKKSQEPSGLEQLKAFDYAAALRFGEDPVPNPKTEAGDDKNLKGLDSVGRIKSPAVGRVDKDDGTREFLQGRRRLAFPSSGNRSATFR